MYTEKEMNETRNQTKIFPEDSELVKAFKTTAYCIILLTSLIGNTFLILAIKRNINSRMRTVSNLLIASVALSDLFMTIWSFPERITRILTNDSWLIPGVTGSILCKAVNFTEKVSITVSVTHLGALSLERFLAVFSPYKTVIKRTYVKYITGALWVGSVLYWSPILYFGNITFKNGNIRCGVRSFVPSWKQWYLAFIIILCAVMLIILVLYSAIALNLCLRKDPRMKLVTQRRKSDHIKRRVVTMVGIIIITFYICFLPYWIGWVWCSYASHMPRSICNQTYKFISILFSYMSCMTNPIVCFIFIGHFRFAFRAILLDPLNRKSNELRLRLGRRSSVTELDSVVPLQARKNERNSVIKEGRQKLVKEDGEMVIQDQIALRNNILNGSNSMKVQQTDDCSEPPTRGSPNNSGKIRTKNTSSDNKRQLKVKDSKDSQNKNATARIPTIYGTPL